MKPLPQLNLCNALTQALAAARVIVDGDTKAVHAHLNAAGIHLHAVDQAARGHPGLAP